MASMPAIHACEAGASLKSASPSRSLGTRTSDIDSLSFIGERQTMNEGADLLLTEIFIRTGQRFGEVKDYRSAAIQTIPTTSKIIQQESIHTATWIAQADELFTDKEAFLNIVGGIEGLASVIAKNRITSYKLAIDSASIVLAHSILDAVAFDCCRVVEIAAPPENWEPFVKKRQISLEELKGKDYRSVLRDKISKYVQELDHKSLNEKIDKLFQLCKPPVDFTPIRDHQYDGDKIKKLDSWRHIVVHGPGLPPPLENCGGNITYMRDTSNFLICLVNHGYGVMINPTLFKESLKMQRKA